MPQPVRCLAVQPQRVMGRIKAVEDDILLLTVDAEQLKELPEYV